MFKKHTSRHAKLSLTNEMKAQLLEIILNFFYRAIKHAAVAVDKT